jgi:RNA polymerase sigma-70 factor (ECF subfamily)
MFGSIVPGEFRHLRTSANGQPALAFYRPRSAGAVHTLAAIQLVSTRDAAIVAVDHFMLAEVYPLFGVPRELAL